MFKRLSVLSQIYFIPMESKVSGHRTFCEDFILNLLTGGITKRENEVKSMALVFSELRKGMEK